MIKELDQKIEETFKEDSIINEAKHVISVAIDSNKFESHVRHIKESKNIEEMRFRIDFLKSILSEYGLIEKKDNDEFGRVSFLDCGNLENF